MSRDNEFSQMTKIMALKRQKNKCGSCGTRIHGIYKIDAAHHKFGEHAEAHHIRHVQQGGTNAVFNCIIICKACHYSVHEGGNYRSKDILATQADFPHFNG